MDTDILIDLLRQFPPAVKWFDALSEDEELAVSGYVLFELIQGCRNKAEMKRVQRAFATYGVVWLSQGDCDKALEMFMNHRLSQNAGMLDMLIGQTAICLGVPLYTFNQKHYIFIPDIQTIQPYFKNV